MNTNTPLTDQSGRPVGMVVTPKGARIEVLGEALPPSQRGASIHVAPNGGGRPHGDFPVKNPNSGPTAKQKPPTPKLITPIDNNTVGRVYTTQLPPPGAQYQNTRLAPDGRPWHEMGWDEIERVGAEAFERWKKAAQTAWDALPGTADAATTAAARQSIGEGAVNTLEGLGTLLGPPAEFTNAAYMSGNADAIALVEQMQQNQRAAISAIGDSVQSAWNEAYARNGAVGASAMVLATLGIEAAGGKGLGALGKAAGTIADIVRAAKTPMEAATKLDEAIAAARAAGASADEIALLERARAERLAQARREAAQGKDGVVVAKKTDTELGGSASSLVGADRAIIDPRKLTEYALNPAHPVGGNKARVFDSALGFNKSNVDDLMSQLREGVMNNPPFAGKVDQFGRRFTVDIPVTGPKGSGVVRSGWIYKTGSDVPEMTTIFVK